MPVRLADGTMLKTNGAVRGLTKIGPWMGVITYQVLDLHFDAVLG